MQRIDKGQSRIVDGASHLLRVLYGVVIASTLMVMVFGASQLEYACKQSFLIPNSYLLLASLSFVLLVVAIACFFSKKSRTLPIGRAKLLDVIVFICIGLLLLAQIAWVCSFAFVTGWDSGLITDLAWALANDQPIDISYLSRYPNNLFLLFIAKLCMEVAILLGADSAFGGVLIFACLNCVSCAVAEVALYLLVKKLTSRFYGVLSLVLFFCIAWLSPWSGILYSDGIVICIPILSLYLYAMGRSESCGHRALCLALLGFIAFVGYKIKPQVLFVAMAIVVWMVFQFVVGLFFGDGLKSVKCCSRSCLKPLIFILLGVLVGGGFTGACTSSLSLKLNENDSFGPAHFLMMGMNTETNGIYLEDDVQYSASFDNPSARSKGNIEEVVSRVVDLGPSGVAELLIEKQMTNFNDGTFAWGVEGRFFDSVHTGSGDGGNSGIARSLYYPFGDNFEYWRVLAQFCWIFILLCIALISLPDSASSKTKDETFQREIIAIALIALIALTLFELLFEARARYLYSSISLYVLVSTMGLNRLLRILKCA